jgi:PAS domain S-box-containing protein
MTTSRSESGPGAKAIEAALAEPPFAAIAAAGCPILVAAGQPARIVWSNAAVQDLFGADSQALQERIFDGQEPGARRLAELAGMLVPGAAPRLEKLRFFMSRRAELLTILCRRTAGPQSLFLVAVPGMKVQPRAMAATPAPISIAPAASFEEEAAGFSQPVIAPSLLELAPAIPEKAPEPVASAPIEKVVPTEPDMPALAPRRGIGDVAADLSARLGATATVRFLWQTDAEHRFVKITGELCDIVGCMTNRLVGRSFIDLADELHLDPDHRLRDALARGETWSGIEVLWPVEDADAALPIMLGALPAHDRERRFEGFRGFGVIHVTRLQPATERQIFNEPAIDIAPEMPVTEHPLAAIEPPASAPADSAPSEPAAPVTEPREDLFTPRKPAAPQGATDNVVTLRPFHVVPRRQAQDDAVEQSQSAPSSAPELPAAVSPPQAAAPVEPSVAQPVPVEPVARMSRADDMVSLSPGERLAFREIARALGARVRTDMPTGAPVAADEPAPAVDVEANRVADARLRDLIEVATRVAQEASSEAVEPVAAHSLDRASDAVPASDFMAHAQAVLDRLPIGVLVKRGETALSINRTLLDLLGYEDAQEFRDENGLAQMFKGRHGEALTETSEGAIPVITHAGDVLALEARMKTMEWDGATASLMTFRRAQEQDLAHRIRTLETELRAGEAEMRELHAILDTATDGVAVLDEEGQILSLNRAGEALFGFDQNEVAGESFTILLAKESQAAAVEYLAGLRLSGVASVLNDGRDVIGRARQGGSIPLFMTLGRVGAAGKPKFCAVLRDMTSWKKAERELREARTEAETASALKSDFLAKISHEIRTPLNAILGFAEVIMEERFGPVGNDRYKDYLKDIHASGSHVMSLVNDLLDLSKIEAGKLELNFGSVDANRIVSECVSLIQPQAARERVIVRLSLAPRLPNIVADERALRQIVLNLLSNAVKFNEPGGQVIVSSALTDAGHAVIRIRDTGIGMSEADIETALEPFRQVATARHTTGTGLGLPLTKALVEANRASFSIKSKKAEGTLVEVAFPPTRVLAE